MHSSHTLFALLLGGALLLDACQPKSKAGNPNLPAGEVIPVKVASLRQFQVADTLVVTGLITTENEARYAFKIGGVIDAIYVNEGQSFKRGQLLARLKASEIDAQYEQATLAYQKAERDYARARNLYQDSVATLEQLQNATTGLDIARKTVEVVAFNRKYAYIYAPASGFVTKKMANAGEVVGPGVPVLAINETDQRNEWVLKLGVNDAEWAATEIDQTAAVTIDGFPGKTFTGFVFRKSQVADPLSGSFQVEVKLNMGTEIPAVGMFGKAVIPSKKGRNVTVIPYDALIEADGKDAFVFAPIAGDRVKRVRIIIESFDKAGVQVRSGLEGIDRVVISNSAFLNEASHIAVIK